MKLVVNLLLGVDMQAIAEAVSLGEHLQIDRNVLLDVLSRTAVVAPAFVGKFQKIRNGDYSAEFPLRLMSKDMDLAMDAARRRVLICRRQPSPNLYSHKVSAYGDLDLAAITPFVAGKAVTDRLPVGRLTSVEGRDVGSTTRCCPGSSSPTRSAFIIGTGPSWANA